MEIGTKVSIVNSLNSRNGLSGIIKRIYPEGMFASYTIYEVDHGNGHRGQYTENQLCIEEK
jgi:hypothetical protein